MTNKVNYDIMILDLIEQARTGLKYSVPQILLAAMNYCHRRNIEVTKNLLQTDDSEMFYNILSKTIVEESPAGTWNTPREKDKWTGRVKLQIELDK